MLSVCRQGNFFKNTSLSAAEPVNHHRRFSFRPRTTCFASAPVTPDGPAAMLLHCSDLRHPWRAQGFDGFEKVVLTTNAYCADGKRINSILPVYFPLRYAATFCRAGC